MNDVQVSFAGEAGRGDCEYWWLPGVEGMPCAADAGAGSSKVCCTACSIVSNISWMRSRKGCTRSDNAFVWCLWKSIMVFMQRTALSSFSILTKLINLSTIFAAWGSTASIGFMGSRWRISSTQFRILYHLVSPGCVYRKARKHTWSGDVDIKTGSPSRILRNTGTR